MFINSKPYLLIGDEEESEKYFNNFMENIIKKNEFKNFLKCSPSGLNYKKSDLDEALYYLSLNHEEKPFFLMIKNANLLSDLNAQLFLTLLEDIKKNIFIFFTTPSSSLIIQTIRSRCIEIILNKENFEINNRYYILEKYKEMLFLENQSIYKINEFLINNPINEIEAKEILNLCLNYLIKNNNIDLFKKIKGLKNIEILPNNEKSFIKLLFINLNS